MSEPRGIHAVARADPERVAFVCARRRTTYGELEAEICRLANASADVGAGRGDRIAVMAGNRPELFAAWNAAARLGAFVVPISSRFTAAEVAYVLADSGASVFFHDDGEAARPALAELADAPRDFAFGDPALAAQSPSLPTEDYLGAAVSLMTYTSGTTGRPKGIERPLPEPRREPGPSRLMEFWGFGADDVHLLAGPAYHAGPGAYAQMHLVEGARVVIMPRFDAADCLGLIETERVTSSHMVPANFVRILEVIDSGVRHDLSSIRKVIHGAAACPIPVKRRVMEVFPPGTVWEYYGMSEGMGSVISPEEWARKPGSVGRPFPGVSFKILGDDGTELPVGEIGNIFTKAMGGARFMYRNAPAKSDAAWRGEYFTVGDLGCLDEDGYLYIADRRVDLVISGGVNIYPAEIEQALAAHPDVVDSAVFGLPDARMGQRKHRLRADRMAGGKPNTEAT